jgi:hypothetical protein
VYRLRPLKQENKHLVSRQPVNDITTSHLTGTVSNQAISNTTGNNEGNTDKGQMQLAEKKGKQANKMGMRDDVNAQRLVLIPTAPGSANLLPERPTISKRKALVTGAAGDGDNAPDV